MDSRHSLVHCHKLPENNSRILHKIHVYVYYLLVDVHIRKKIKNKISKQLLSISVQL